VNRGRTTTTPHNNIRLKEGLLIEELSSWQEFHGKVIIRGSNRGYIWRGQKKDEDNVEPWFLESSFDRDFRNSKGRERNDLLRRHIKTFKKEMNQSHPNVLPKSDDDIWALGQHYGLKTPLLDWTLSPYIAAYFAFEEEEDDRDDKYRYVYALNRSVTRLLSKEKGKVDRFVGVVEQLTHPTPRFLAQRTVFTKALDGKRIESAVKRFSEKRPNEVPLVKFKIPTKCRAECLRDVDLMNINRTSLLLDFRDVADRCNKVLNCDRPCVSKK
jgi:hypothetical protein